jgi:ABC-2 type transport system ATP-binding protein
MACFTVWWEKDGGKGDIDDPLRGIPSCSFDQLSTGMKQRLSLAKSMINDPAILFLDEPTAGLDPSVSIRIREMVLSIQKEKGMTVLLTTHNMKEAEFSAAVSPF